MTQWPCDNVARVTLWPHDSWILGYLDIWWLCGSVALWLCGSVALWLWWPCDPVTLWSLETRDPRPWYKGGWRYGIWPYIYVHTPVIRPHARRCQYDTWWRGPRVWLKTSSFKTLHHRPNISLYIPHKWNTSSKTAKGIKIHKKQISSFKKNTWHRWNIYVYYEPWKITY